MANKQFDDMLRHTIQREEIILSSKMQSKFEETLRSSIPTNTIRRILHRGLALTAIFILVFSSIAIATSNWGVLDFFALYDNNGTRLENPYLAEKVQSIGEILEGDGFTYEIIDVIADNASIAISTRYENGRANDIYLVTEIRMKETGQVLLNDMGYSDAQFTYVRPGETVETVFVSSLDSDLVDGDYLHIALAVFENNGELVKGDEYFTSDHEFDPTWSEEEKRKRREAFGADDEAKHAEYENMRKSNPNTVFFTHGKVEIPYGYDNSAISYVEQLRGSGLLGSVLRSV